MEIKTINDCLEHRLLRKIKPDVGKSRKSIEIAEKQLKMAKESINSPLLNLVIVSVYMAMFHASRALMYRDGVQEKSHYAVFVYIKEKYTSELSLPIVNLLDIYRIQRHDALYGLDFESSKEDAISAVKDADKFVSSIKNILGGKVRK